MNNDKTDYIFRMFRHTRNKDRENYVILGIWHRLRKAGLSSDLQPITQQYVKRSEGRYALLDLFFPAINLAVECDEAYHKRNAISDLEREKDVFKAFAKCHAEDSIKEIGVPVDDSLAVNAEGIDVDKLEVARVDASVTYQEVDDQLDFVVLKIKERFIAAGSPVWDCRSPDVIVAEKGYVDVAMRLTFKDIPQILMGLNIRKIDGTAYDSWGRGAFDMRDQANMSLWFPHLSFNAGGWKNKLKNNGRLIVESRGVGHSEEEEKMRRAATTYWARLRKGCSQRAVFAHSKNEFGENGYRFMGVFELNDVLTEGNEESPTSLVWSYISNRYLCLQG